MELPKASENVFPLSEENLSALLDHYFPDIDEDERQRSFVLWLEKDWGLNFSLNQMEFCARFCRENEVLLDMSGFANTPAARIYFLLMALFIPVEKWDRTAARSHKERLKEFKSMFLHKEKLFNKISSSGFQGSVFPKTRKNLSAILDFYFPQAGEAETKLSIIQFSESRETLGYIHFAAQFCKENKDFLNEVGVSQSPSERIHEVVTAIFYPSYKWLPMEFENNGVRYKELNEAYLNYISIYKIKTSNNSTI